MIEIVLFAAISTLLYRLGMGPLLFLIPLQVLLVRRGTRAFVSAGVLSLLLILLVGFVLARGWTSDGGALVGTVPFILLDMAVALILVGGLALIQLPEIGPELQVPRHPRVTRLAIATALAGLLFIPVILYLRSNEMFATGVRELLVSRIDAMNDALTASQSGALIGGVQPLQAETLLELVSMILLRSYLFYYFLVLGFSWWLGTIIGNRSLGRKPGIRRIADFKLPDQYIWPLIASLAVVLLSLIVSVQPLEILGWNALLILLFLYGVSGLGIIRFLLRKLKVRPGVRWLIIVSLVLLALTPRLGFLILILVPGLGVSEIWLKYRTKERSKL